MAKYAERLTDEPVCEREAGYLYFIDKEGYPARTPMARKKLTDAQRAAKEKAEADRKKKIQQNKMDRAAKKQKNLQEKLARAQKREAERKEKLQKKIDELEDKKNSLK